MVRNGDAQYYPHIHNALQPPYYASLVISEFLSIYDRFPYPHLPDLRFISYPVSSVKVQVGQMVSGTGIQANTFVTHVDDVLAPKVLKIDKETIAAISSEQLTFHYHEITLVSVDHVAVGQPVSGANIQPDTIVTAVNAGKSLVSLSKPPFAT